MQLGLDLGTDLTWQLRLARCPRSRRWIAYLRQREDFGWQRFASADTRGKAMNRAERVRRRCLPAGVTLEEAQ